MPSEALILVLVAAVSVASLAFDPKCESLFKALMDENANLKRELWKERNKNK